MRRFSAVHLDQDVNQSGFADVFGGVGSFGLQPAAFSFFGFLGGHFAVRENDLHRAWFGDVIQPEGCVCIASFSPGARVFSMTRTSAFSRMILLSSGAALTTS
jgi:hypothetical protein